jgi:hypothetical protein
MVHGPPPLATLLSLTVDDWQVSILVVALGVKAWVGIVTDVIPDPTLNLKLLILALRKNDEPVPRLPICGGLPLPVDKLPVNEPDPCCVAPINNLAVPETLVATI